MAVLLSRPARAPLLLRCSAVWPPSPTSGFVTTAPRSGREAIRPVTTRVTRHPGKAQRPSCANAVTPGLSECSARSGGCYGMMERCGGASARHTAPPIGAGWQERPKPRAMRAWVSSRQRGSPALLKADDHFGNEAAGRVVVPPTVQGVPRRPPGAAVGRPAGLPREAPDGRTRLSAAGVRGQTVERHERPLARSPGRGRWLGAAQRHDGHENSQSAKRLPEHLSTCLRQRGGPHASTAHGLHLFRLEPTLIAVRDQACPLPSVVAAPAIAAARPAREETPTLAKARVKWSSTVFAVTNISSAMPLFVRP